MPHFVLPDSAFKDVKLLLGLDADRLRRFDRFFATAASVTAHRLVRPRKSRSGSAWILRQSKPC